MLQHAAPSAQIIPFSIADDESAWLRFFDLNQAKRKVVAHIATLPSSKSPERHTLRAYTDGLNYWFDWSQGRLPSEDAVTEYIAHLMQGRGLASSTIAAKYLAPLRHLLRALVNQQITSVDLHTRNFIDDCRLAMRAGLSVKAPRKETTSNEPALWREGIRLSSRQVNETLWLCKGEDTIKGDRDYALLLTAFESALRVAELGRITLDSIKAEGSLYLIRVRGKRNNIDPVPVSIKCYNAICAYVARYNEGLEADDPRRIHDDTPLWQPLTRSSNYVAIEHFSHGLTSNSISSIIGTRTQQATDTRLAAHDTRRTAAAMAYKADMPLTDIQRLLRHKSAAVTLHYVGNEPDYESSALASRVNLG